MIQTTPSTVKYGTVDTYAAIVAAEAKKASVPVCLHLDHGSSFELAMQAMHAGYTSVMIDGSKLERSAVKKMIWKQRQTPTQIHRKQKNS